MKKVLKAITTATHAEQAWAFFLDQRLEDPMHTTPAEDMCPKFSSKADEIIRITSSEIKGLIPEIDNRILQNLLKRRSSTK